MTKQSPSMKRACVVIPMYNEGPVIAEVVATILTRFERVVCVDDGSGDDCASIARAAGATVLQHPVNLGQGAAIETGIRFAIRDPSTTHVVTFDADGQHDVNDAAAMVLHCIEHDLQVVLGSRFLATTHSVPPARRILLRAATCFSQITTGLQLSDAHNGLRVFRRDAARHLSLRMHGMSHASEILGKIAAHGWTYAEHPVTITYTDYSRAKGQRAYNAFNIAFDVAFSRLRHVT